VRQKSGENSVEKPKKQTAYTQYVSNAWKKVKAKEKASYRNVQQSWKKQKANGQFNVNELAEER